MNLIIFAQLLANHFHVLMQATKLPSENALPFKEDD